MEPDSNEPQAHDPTILTAEDEAIADTLTFAVANGEQIARYFSYAHLPPHLRDVSRRYAKTAVFTLTLPRCAERTVALRKLLEGKDAAVRAALVG